MHTIDTVQKQAHEIKPMVLCLFVFIQEQSNKITEYPKVKTKPRHKTLYSTKTTTNRPQTSL